MIVQNRELVGRVTSSLRDGAELNLKLCDLLSEKIAEVGLELVRCFRAGGKVLLAGNGGSAADAQHIAAEFVGRFIKDRAPLPAIALTTDSSALTCIGNDYSFEEVFSRQVRALGRPGDVLIAISTSGNSANVLAAVAAASELGMVTVGLTGGSGGKLAATVFHSLVVPHPVTARIQECHLTIEHILCEIVEGEMFGDAAG